jgi:DNA-binding MarR family transcriptional regulator
LTINTELNDTAAAAALADEILNAINAARGASQAEGYRSLLGRSVSMTHMHVMATLRATGPMRMSELARRLDVSLANATGIVTRMEERGLVERGRDDTDRRVVTVSLAAGGEEAFGAMDSRSRAFFTEVLRELTPEELAQLRDGMHAMFHAARTVVARRSEQQ